MLGPKVALTHRPSPRMAQCELTFLERSGLDLTRAAQQHAAYCRQLRQLGWQVEVLDDNAPYPDACFVEDLAVILPELILLTRSGVASRRGESIALRKHLQKLGPPLLEITAPGTLEGGDVLRVANTVFVGRSTRTNPEGIRQLRVALRPFGYEVVEVDVGPSLHLKTACTAIDDRTVLLNPDWCDIQPLLKRGYVVLTPPPSEPFAANTLRIESQVWVSASHPQLAAELTERGYDVRTVEITEFEKAEGGLTCLSLLCHRSGRESPSTRLAAAERTCQS